MSINFPLTHAQASDFSLLLKVMEKDMVALEKTMEGRSGARRTRMYATGRHMTHLA